MAYTLPVPGDLKARFPEFADTADPTVAVFINAASLWVDDSWLERDYPVAIIYLAAHYLQLYKKSLLSTGGGGGGGGSGSEEITTFVSEIKFEDFDIKFGSGGKSSSTTSAGGGATSSSAALMASTVYGMLYEQLRDRNVVPFAIV